MKEKVREENPAEAVEAGIERRAFLKTATLGALGMVQLGVLTGCISPQATAAESADANEVRTLPLLSIEEGRRLTLEEVKALRKELLDSKGEYTCADGTVIPAAYVKLRALINSIGLGCGSDITDTSFTEVMYLFSEEEAQAYIEMPSGQYFTATDLSAQTGRSEEESLALCEALSTRGLLYRTRRAGVPYFHQLAEAHGIWEYHLLADRTADYIKGHNMSWGTDVKAQLYNSETPFYYTIPVNKKVVADEEILPYDDYEKIIRRNTIIGVSTCQCRLNHTFIDIEDPGNHPIETCITTGEEAEYYIENGIARQIDQEEALAILRNAVEVGMVIQSAHTKATEVICCCHGDCCDILRSYVAMGSEKFPTLNSAVNVSHYLLKHDKDVCIKCGSCKPRCPLFTIEMDDEGYPAVGGNCVRCGQCGTVCPVEARKLVKKDDEDIVPLPATMLDDYNLKSEFRFRNNMIY